MTKVLHPEFVMRMLSKKGYAYLKDINSESNLNSILADLDLAKQGKLAVDKLNLNDSDDSTNTIYSSRRSPIEYCYLKTDNSSAAVSKMTKNLTGQSALNWNGNINQTALPVFIYSTGSYIKKHRDRNVGYGENIFIAVLMMTEPTVDFDEGYFFLNDKADATVDGKIVFFEDLRHRIYFQIEQGDALIFDNRRFIHGTTPVKSGQRKKIQRITSSLRADELLIQK